MPRYSMTGLRDIVFPVRAIPSARFPTCTETTRVGSSAQTLTDSTPKTLYETVRGWETTGACQNLSLSHHDPVQFACTSAILDRV